MKNLVGQRFERLVVLEELPESNKLTDEIVEEIKLKYSSNQFSYAELGRIYNCDPTHIRRTIIGERWK